MFQEYPAVYRDTHGEEPTSITNDGRQLRMVVRGIEFMGTDFDSLDPVGSPASEQLATFTFETGSLCACTITCDIPVPVIMGREMLPGNLHMHLELGNPRPAPRGGIDREDLVLVLSVSRQTFTSRGQSRGFFEDELQDIQAALSEGMYIKACISCAFSDYHPVGHGLFGGLACFRGNKETYRAAKGKTEVMRLWDTMTEFVQETYLCPEFEKRQPAAGYRG